MLRFFKKGGLLLSAVLVLMLFIGTLHIASVRADDSDATTSVTTDSSSDGSDASTTDNTTPPDSTTDNSTTTTDSSNTDSSSTPFSFNFPWWPFHHSSSTDASGTDASSTPFSFNFPWWPFNHSSSSDASTSPSLFDLFTGSSTASSTDSHGFNLFDFLHNLFGMGSSTEATSTEASTTPVKKIVPPYKKLLDPHTQSDPNQDNNFVTGIVVSAGTNTITITPKSLTKGDHDSTGASTSQNETIELPNGENPNLSTIEPGMIVKIAIHTTSSGAIVGSNIHEDFLRGTPNPIQ